MNKTVLITGSSRGIGLALAKQYQSDGWNVIGAARNPSTAEKVGLSADVEAVQFVQLDTSDEDSIIRAAKDLEGEAIGVLINNAGIADLQETFESMTKESMIKQFEVNAVGPFLVTRAFVPHLKAAVTKSGSAKLAQITTSLASIALHDGTIPYPGYRMSKAALNMAHMNITHELKSDKIICATICPGYVATDMTNYVPGTLQPSESAAAVSKVIAGLTPDDTGVFFNHVGDRVSW
ncbi:hypothetical protein Poli38472_007143 [Pythium oligandrum]|uniref:C-factor n=1 Tax=Pythium oligandrum TaxID=41045 RepID=A0A8K1C9P3_PYTOL|nr:hypothetical protein Poli38472_007143 [Pythium oligandrum]|eukprot:TMW58998.1 hypothetical protein Poli38472_007143 [Pythium oligandrum]